MGFLYLHFQGLCHQEGEWSFVTIPNTLSGRQKLTSHSQGFSPCWTASSAFSYLFWGCTEGHGVPYGVLGAGPEGGGKEGRIALGGAVTKPGAMISQTSRLLRLGEYRGAFLWMFSCHQPIEQVLHTGAGLTALFLLPDSVITPISSLWRRVCRITTTSTGMMPSSGFSNVLVEAELFPLTGSQKSPAGKKRASWNCDWGFCTAHLQATWGRGCVTPDKWERWPQLAKLCKKGVGLL